MAYQSLYRRYRSQRFSEVLGQEHVTRALRNAVREGRVGHGYLFSGPRGTGKTSTARILAKVLNCEAPVDGEPDTTCDACRAVEEGRQVDWLQELDAASNNGVDAMRDLLGRVSMGTSGNRKVYVLDEVHMLSTAASNALLKTLEEPPEHVVFVLATTEPEKVLPTIRSRTQHFEFNLLPADVLADHVRHVIADAGLDLGDDVVDHVVRVGRGSARDTLSALDQVAAAGGVGVTDTSVDDLLDALGRRDAGGALVAVDASVRAGRDPRVLAEQLIHDLRAAFLVAMGAPTAGLTERAQARAAEVADALGAAALTRALEAVGRAVVDMRHAPDARIPLEVALVQIARPEAAGDLDALLRRVEQLELAVASNGAGTPTSPGGGPAPSRPPERPSGRATPGGAGSPAARGGSATEAPATAAPGGSAPAGSSPGRPAPGGPAAASSTATPRPAAEAPRGPQAARARLARHEAAAAPAPEPAASPPDPGARPALGALKRQGGPPPEPGAGEAPSAPSSPSGGVGARPTPDASGASEPSAPPTGGVGAPPTPDAPRAGEAPSAPSSPSGGVGDPPTPPAPGAGEPTAPPSGGVGALPTLDELVAGWDEVLGALKGRAKALYKMGRVVGVDDTAVRFAVPNEPSLKNCREKLDEVHAALASRFGRPVRLELVVDGDAATAPRPEPAAAGTGEAAAEDDIDLDELVDAPDATAGGLAQLQDAFPGAELLEER